MPGGTSGGRPGGRSVGRAVLAVAALLAVSLSLLGGAAPASAHAVLTGSDPRDGTVLKKAPDHVTVTFDESVALFENSVRVLDPDNRPVTAADPGRANGRGSTARVPLTDGLRNGTYTVAWRVVSADSHAVSGAFTFSVGAPSRSRAAVTAEPAVDPAVGLLYGTARYVAYAGLALLIGVAAFALFCGPGPVALRALRRPFLVGWWALLLSTAALLMLRGPYASGTGPGGVLDPELLRRTVTERPGIALSVRLALVLLVAVLMARPVRRVGLKKGSAERPGPRSEPKSGTDIRTGPDTDPGTGPEHAPESAPRRGHGPASGGRPHAHGPLLIRVTRVPRVTRILATALALAFAGTWAVAEHASVGIQVPVALVSTVLHLLAMGVWLGGLTALLTVLFRCGGEELLPAAVVARFSRLALVSVSVLAATGVYQSWRGLGSWDALLDTPYGRVLSFKVWAVALLLVVASYSRRWTGRLVRVRAPRPGPVLVTVGAGVAADTGATGATADGGPAVTPPEPGTPLEPVAPPEAGAPPPPGPGMPPDPDDTPPASGTYRRALRRSVLAEVLVGVVVLVLTTVLTGTRPGRAAAEAAPAPPVPGQPTESLSVLPFDTGTPTGHGKVQVVLEPGRVGRNTVEAVTYGPDGSLVGVPELRLTFTLADRHVGPLNAGLVDERGYWGSDTLDLPLAGTWTMKVTVRVSDIDEVTVSRKVKIN